MGLLLSVGATFGYIISQMKTNDVLVFVSGNSVESATLTPQGNYVLIPYDATSQASDEKTSLSYTLFVKSNDTLPFTITHELPEAFEIVDYDPNVIYYTNANYTITIRLLEEYDDNLDFHLIVNF